MTVQDHLGRERWMPTDLDGDVTPFGIEDMKQVIIDVDAETARSAYCLLNPSVILGT